MNRLWVRLSLAFGLVTLTAIIIAALLANYQVSTEFRQFVTHGQMIDTVAPELVQFYAAAGSIRDFMELGGPVLNAIALVILVMWILILERFQTYRRLGEAGIDAGTVEGTGPGGRVTKEDAVRAVEQPGASPAPA